MRNAFMALTFLIVFPAGLLYGQAVTTGTINGATKDQSGAAIPGVTLTLTDTAMGRVNTGVSDEAGAYRFLSVPSGSGYTLKAELSGFRSVTVSDISVRPGGSQRFDIVLAVGELAEELTVTAEAPLINVESSQVAEGLGEAITKSIPLLRRDFTEIAVLFQGIQHNATDDSGFFTQFHARGMPTTSNGYRIDGANAVWMQAGRIGVRMTKTAVEQYEFIAGGFSAEYGEQPGSVINLTTKSGKNATFWDYSFLYKPEAFTSEIKSGLPNQVNKKSKGYTHFEEFSIGGAILQNRLFFFNALQYSDEDLGNLVAPKTRHSYFTSNHMKITYDRGNDRWDFNIDFNPGYQYRTGYRSAETSPESERQQRVLLYFHTIKNTRTFGSHWVMETLALLHHTPTIGPPEARVYHPKGSYTGPLRTKDFVNVFTPTGRFTTGPANTYGGSSWKRFRIGEKFVWNSGTHNARFGGDYSRTWGASWNREIVRNFTDQRQVGGRLTRTTSEYGRPDSNNNEVAVYIQDGWRISPRILLEVGIRLDGQSAINDINNVAPRWGLTIDPTGTARNRFYANWGFFYEYVPQGTINFGKATLVERLYRVDNADANFNGTEILQNEFRQVRTPTLSAPLVNSWSVGYERLLPGQFKIGATYAGNRQHRRFTSLRSSTEDFQNNDGRISYRGLEVNWRRPFLKRFELSGNYTWSRTLGDTPSSVTILQRPYRYAHMDWHEPHVSSVLAMVDLWGFVATPKFQFNSGRRYSITNPTVGTAVQFVDLQGNQTGRNVFHAANISTIDLSVSRRFATESWNVSPTVQILNLTNRINILSVSGNFFTPGLPTNVGDSRQIQIGVDIGFGR